MIKVSKENDCVGCAQGCIRCGRQHSYLSLDDLICDECGDSFEKVYDYNGNQFCLECLANVVGADEVNEKNYTDYIPDFDEDDE